MKHPKKLEVVVFDNPLGGKRVEGLKVDFGDGKLVEPPKYFKKNIAVLAARPDKILISETKNFPCIRYKKISELGEERRSLMRTGAIIQVVYELIE